MKIYIGMREGVGGPQSVKVVEDGQARPLVHRMRHSPDGFQWGYGGSGPADLARSILWDHLGHEPQPSVYQAFKFAFVASFGEVWELVSDEIDEWLFENFSGKEWT